MNADSVKARLKNFAVSSGCTFQEALVYYGLERTIYRISVSPYADHFVLKGGIFLYAIFDKILSVLQQMSIFLPDVFQTVRRK